MISSRARFLLFIKSSLILLIFNSAVSYSLTLDEAISLAKENLPLFRSATMRIKSTEALYNASLSPYLPSLDASASHEEIFTSSDEFDSRIYDLTLSYTLFDGGNRKANRNIARLNFDISKEDLRRIILDLEFNVKVAFFTAIAGLETLKQRKIQLDDAKKDFEVAEGRYKFGVAKLSDVLQASVRLEQAKFNLVQAEGEYNKALSELNSLIGEPLESTFDIEGSLDFEIEPPDVKLLYNTALERPEIKQAEDSMEIAGHVRALSLSTFYPEISLNASYTKAEGDRSELFLTEEKAATLIARWNLFELGKFFELKSSDFEKEVSKENLNELKRQIMLDVYKSYEDFMTATKNLLVAREQLRQAEHNYSEAFAQYKIGKADILSLIQAESLLANAREQMVSSKLNLILSKSLLERSAGIPNLESLKVQH